MRSGEPRVLAMALRNDRRELTRIGERVDAFGHECGLSHDETAQINLVLDEMVSNVIKYGYADAEEHRIDVTVTVDSHSVQISIEDEGKAFNPLEAPVPDLDLSIEERPIGGLGVFLVRSIVDTFDYRREGNRNVVTLRKTRHAEA